MKKIKHLIFSSIFLISQVVYSQLSTYTFSSTTGSYTEIFGGTVLGTETTDDQRFVNPSAPLGGNTLTGVGLPIGFTFNFDGSDFDVFAVNANGWISLGNSLLTPSVNIASTSSNVPLNNTTVINPDYLVSRIALFARDLQAQAGAELRYETLGNSPNRILVVQWKNYRRYGGSGVSYNGQIRLYETSNAVELIYGTMNNNSTTDAAPQVGLRGAPSSTASNFANRTTTNNWASSNAGTSAIDKMMLNSNVYPVIGLTYRWAPPSCFAPTNVLTSNYTTSTVDISWSQPGTGTPVSYEWKIVLSGAGIGGNAEATGSINHPSINTQATGLTPATSYHLYIRSFCGGSDYSDWAGPYLFSTTQILANIPFNENFEVWPNSWTEVNGTQTNIWHVGSATAYAGTQAAYITNNNGVSNAYTTTNATSVVHLYRDINFSGGAAFNLSFRWKSSGESTYDYMRVYLVPTSIVPVAGTLLTGGNIGSMYYNQQSSWQSELIELQGSTYANQTWRLVFTWRNDAGSGNQPPAAIDDINITAITCPAPSAPAATNITYSTANLYWTSNGNESSWNIEYGVSGFTPTGTPQITGATNPQLVSGLNDNTTYQYYVQADCGGGDLSAWVGPFTFTTPCMPLTVPYFEGFESITTNNQLPQCMAATSLGTKTLTYITSDTYNRIPKTGDKFASFAWAPSGNWFFSQPLHLIAGKTYDASLWFITDGTSGFTTLNFAYGNEQIGSSMAVFTSVPNPENTTYEELTGSFTPSTTGVYYLGIQAEGTSTNPWYLSFDDIYLEQAPTCPGVQHNSLSASNPTHNSIELQWIETGNANQWQLEYSATGFVLGTGTSISASTNPYTLQGLNMDSTYDIYIRSLCAPGDTGIWNGPVSFTTLCIIFSNTITESFENLIAPPECWSMWYENTNPSAGNEMIHSNVQAYSGSKSFRFSSFSSGTPYGQYLQTPLLDYNTDMEVSFMYKKHIYGTETFTVGTSIDGINWLWSADISDASASEWKKYSSFFSSNVNYIAINYKSDFQYYLYIDNFSIQDMPSCPGILPGTFEAINATTNSIELIWAEWTPSTEWQIEYGFKGFVPGTGTLASVNSNPFVVNNLSHSKTYDIYIRSVCAPSDTSNWTGPLTFSTLCSAFDVPLFENFDAVNIPDLPLCWSKIEQATTTTANIASSNISSHSSSNSIRFNNSTDINAQLLLISPEINTALNTLSVQFYAKNSLSGADIIVGTITDPLDANTFTPVTTISLNTVFTHYSVFLNSITNSDNYIAFKLLSSVTNATMYLDDIIIDEVPSCLWVTNLNSDTTTHDYAVVSWQAQGSETQWQLEYLPAGMPQGSGTFIILNNNPDTLFGLQSSTQYEFYVRAICGNMSGDTSMWTGPTSFSTTCSYFNIYPYFQGFENNFPPLCWTTSLWEQSSYGAPYTGFEWAYSNITGSELTTPEFVVPTPNGAYFSFWYRAESASYPQNFNVLLSTDGINFTIIKSFTGVNNTLYQQYTYNLQAYTGQSVWIRFAGQSGSGGLSYGVLIDDFFMDELPLCNQPTALDAINITTTTAELIWGTPAYNGWEIEWDTTGFALGAGNTVYTTTSSYGLTSLDVFTSYDFYVRAYCMFDTTAWAGPYTFTTLDSCYAPDSVAVIDVSLNFVELAWYSTGSIWEIEWDMAGFTQGSGNTVITDDNPYILSGLIAGSVYEFYIRTVCDSVLGVYSDWSGPYAFVTLCNVVDVFPWNDKFDNALAPDFFPCWNKIWISGGETWYVENLQAQFGTQYVGIEPDAIVSQNELLATPIFDFSLLAHPYFSFWWNTSYEGAVTINNFDVYLLITTDNGNTIDTLWSEIDEGVFTSWTWYETMIDLTSYAGESNIMLGFNYAGFDGAAFYFDNVTVHDTTTVGVVKPIVTDLNVNIYPNPNNGLFNMYMLSDTETLTVTVLNIQGKVVYEEQLSDMAYGVNTELNLRSLASGIYHLRLSDGKTTLNKKLIIK